MFLVRLGLDNDHMVNQVYVLFFDELKELAMTPFFRREDEGAPVTHRHFLG